MLGARWPMPLLPEARRSRARRIFGCGWTSDCQPGRRQCDLGPLSLQEVMANF